MKKGVVNATQEEVPLQVAGNKRRGLLNHANTLIEPDIE